MKAKDEHDHLFASLRPYQIDEVIKMVRLCQSNIGNKEIGEQVKKYLKSDFSDLLARVEVVHQSKVRDGNLVKNELIS